MRLYEVMIIKEEWKEINGYKISNYGKVINKKGIELSTKPNKHGYISTSINMGGEYGKVRGMHRIVAVAFIPNPDNLPEVNHIDGDKTNNIVNNLEWTTRKDNMQHSSENRLHPKTTWCCIVDDDGNVSEIYESMNILTRHYGMKSSAPACQCILGECGTRMGLRIREYSPVLKDYVRTRFDDPSFKYKCTAKRKIRCVENGTIYNSQMEASNMLNISQPSISEYLRGNRLENVDGYTFEYC